MTRIVVILTCLLLTSNVHADNCGTTIRSYPHVTYYSPPIYSHVEKVVYREIPAPIAVPLLVPSSVFQYLPALSPVISIPVSTAAAPVVATPAPVSPVASSTVNQGQTSIDIERMVNERVERAIRERFNSVTPGDSGPPPLILPNDFTKAPEPQVAPTTSIDVKDEEVPQRVAQLLANNCAKCHTAGEKVSGSVTLFVKKDTQLYLQPSIAKNEILKAVAPPTTLMPPDAKGNKDSPAALKGNDLVLLQRWVNQQ